MNRPHDRSPASPLQLHGLFAHVSRDGRNPLNDFHRHNEIELNFLTRGRASYSLAGHIVDVPLKRLCLFWGGFLHKLTRWENAENWSLAIPLQVFLSWPLPRETFVHPLLNGALLHDTNPDRSQRDLALMHDWHADLTHNPSSSTRNLVLLEAQTRLRRLSRSVGTSETSPVEANDLVPTRVAHMLWFIAENYRDPALKVSHIAAAADTNLSYAMDLFRKSCGTTIMQYVNHQRVSHAQRMLATTDAKVLRIASESGFGSPSQFYNVFRRISDTTPRAYARTHRARTGDTH